MREKMDDAYAIRLAKTELRDAYNTGDVNRVLSVYADAYSDMSAGRASFYGTEANAVLKHGLTKLFARYHARLAVTIISIGIQGDLAFDWGWHKLTLTPRKGGRPKTTRARYLEIWRIDEILSLLRVVGIENNNHIVVVIGGAKNAWIG